MVRPHDQDERETDGAMHGNRIIHLLKGRFRSQLEKEFTDEDWFHCFYLGSIKTRFEICKDEKGELRKIRAIQGHSSGVINFTKIYELRDVSLQVETIHLSRGSSTRPILHSRNWIGGRRKGT